MKEKRNRRNRRKVSGRHPFEQALFAENENKSGRSREDERPEEEQSAAAAKNFSEESVKKSDLNAGSLFDYEWITCPHPHLMPMRLQEEAESLKLTYDCSGRRSMEEIRGEDRAVQLLLLIRTAELEETGRDYCFDLMPVNLYYDSACTVFVRHRDVYAEGKSFSARIFLEQYKSLAAAALQKKYSYEDYMYGGLSLLSENKRLAPLADMENVSDIRAHLEAEYRDLLESRSHCQLLPTAEVRKRKRFTLLLGMLLAVLFAFTASWFWLVEPGKDAGIALAEAYLRTDYAACISAMQQIGTEKMTAVEKYLLATAYVRTENITSEQKENVLNTLSIDGLPERLDYWIAVGRNQTEEAADLGIRLGDAELQLYAYMKAKQIAETDTSMSGEEKEALLEELEQKIDGLKADYDQEDVTSGG